MFVDRFTEVLRYNLILVLLLPMVVLANTAPVITSTPNSSVTEDSLYEYLITATDDDGDVLVYSVIQRPSWMTYNSSTHTLSGTPTNENVGSHNVSVSVSDGVDTVDQTFSVLVVNANDIPYVTNNIDNLSLTEDVNYEQDVTLNFADDDLEDILIFSAEGMPTGLSISSTGRISGAANNEDAKNSPFNVTITVTDRSSATASTDFQISVTNVNDAPEPTDDSVTLSEDGNTTIDILNNDVDVDNDIIPSTAFITNTPVHGDVSISTSSGLVTYTPDADYSGTDSFQYRITDPSGLVGTATVNLTILEINDPPVSQNDVASTEEDTTIAIDVIANDSDIDPDDAPQGDQIIIETLAANGSIQVIAGKVEYTPDPDYSGTDSFTYKVADSNGEYTDIATVFITVGPVNDFPIAADDVASTTEDNEVSFAVHNNDIDTEDGAVSPSTITIINQPQNGSVSLNGDGTLSYTPDPDFNGSDSFDYTINDSDGYSSNAATVTLTVKPVNDNPQANNDLVVVEEDTTIEINVLGNDTDIDDPDTIDSASVTISTDPSHGSLSIDTITGIVTYTPEADYFGNDYFAYSMADTGSLTSNDATVSITITSVNDAPRLSDDSTTTDEDTSVTINIVTNDEDIDGSLSHSTLTFTQDPVHGTATFNSSGQVVYEPELNYYGNDQFSYTISDDEGVEAEKAATVLITINSVNDQPLADDSSTETYEDKSVDITLTGSDVDGDTLSYEITSGPSNGSLSGSNGDWTYLGDENYYGSDSFTFTSSDGLLTSEEATIYISVISVNDRPVATAQSLEVDEDGTITIELTGTDIDGDDLTFSLSSSDLSGTITGSPPTLVYTPAENFYGEEYLSFIANDGELDSASETITIDVQAINDQPVAQAQDLFLAEDSSIAFTLDASDVDNDNLTYTIESEPTHGQISGVAPNLIYVPDENYYGSDEMVYYVNDGVLDSEQATVTFSVSANADDPVAHDMTISGDEDSQIAITLSGEDPDGNAITFQIVTNPIHGTISGVVPDLTYEPNPDYTGNDLLEFKVSDGSTDSNIAVVNIDIIAINDAPDARDDEYSLSMAGKNWLTMDVRINDIDIDGDDLVISSAQSNLGDVSITDNKLRYVPIEGFTGDVLIDYVVEDPDGLSDHARVFLEIRNNNDSEDPQITTSGDINMVATGRLTRVEFESPIATDANGELIGVELLNNQRNFPPGGHNIFWRATDSEGRVAIVSQKVNIYPLVSVKPGQAVEEGQSGQVEFKLNGPAPFYPIVIPYALSGSATLGIDYEMETGQVWFYQGTQTSVSFDTIIDEDTEGTEQLVVSIGESNYSSAQSTHTIDIIEDNATPRVKILGYQNDQPGLKFEQSGGQVHLKVEIHDPNEADSHHIRWDPPVEVTQINTPGEREFIFEPSELNQTIFQFSVEVTDDSSEAAVGHSEIFIEILAQHPTLGSGDSDGDLLSDETEGHGDDDHDGIANYLDPLNECDLMPQYQQITDSFLVEVQHGGCLRLGQYSLDGDTGGLLLNPDQIPTDPDSQNRGGLFDFIIHDIDLQSTSINVVIPQREPIPDDAIYRKYQVSEGWYTFVEDQNNKVSSALGSHGSCPPPLAEDWQTGLTAGHWCVRLTIEDGGPNDDDEQINRVISDPGGVATFVSGNHIPVANDDNGTLLWNSSESFDVLANDTDADNDDLTIVSVQAQIGTVEVEDDQRLYYTALENFIGEDQVNYSISDGHGGIANGVLNLVVIGNNPPVAQDDSSHTTNDKSLTLNVLLNDSDLDDDPLTIIDASIISSAGSVQIDNNAIIYTPHSSFIGTAVIDYHISDGQGGTAHAQVFISVTAPVVQPEPPTNPTPPSDGGSSGGGSLGWFTLILLGWIRYVKK